MKKYFEFSGTINGTNYFLRNLLSTVFAYCGGWLTGYGIGSGQNLTLMMGLVVLVPTLWFNLCTIFKRSNALFPQYAIWITIGMIVFQILGEVNQLFNILSMIMGLILIFKNSNIDNHEG